MTPLSATAIQTAEPAVRAATTTQAAAPLAMADGAPGFADALQVAGQGAAPAETKDAFFHQRSKSGELKPLQQFESFVLRTFVENMLPSENTSFFGTGTAGQIWKSMLAERIGDEMAASGGIGIADLLKDREPSVKAATGAAASAHAADIGTTSAE